MVPSLRFWVVFALGAVLAGGAWATFRVVPDQKAATPRRDEAPAGKRPDRPAGAAEPRARDAAGDASRCAEELTSMSLGVDDPAARERLKSRRCD